MGSMEDNLKTGWQEVGVNNRETRIQVGNKSETRRRLRRRQGDKGRQGEATVKEEREKLDNSEPYGRQVTTSGRQVESKETSGKHGCNSVARFPEPSWNLGSLQSGGKSGSPSLLEMKPNSFLAFWFARVPVYLNAFNFGLREYRRDRA